jgi:hypothetical protein
MKKHLIKMQVGPQLLQKVFHNLKTQQLIKYKKIQTKNKKNL